MKNKNGRPIYVTEKEIINEDIEITNESSKTIYIDFGGQMKGVFLEKERISTFVTMLKIAQKKWEDENAPSSTGL